jgi:hypothetical protein
MKNTPILTSQKKQTQTKIEYRKGKAHKNARTTWEIRRKIKTSKKSNVYLAQKYGIHPLTVAKWKKRTSVLDVKAHSSGRPQEIPLSPLDEALIFFFRKAAGLTIDEMVLVFRQYLIPSIKRCQIYNCLFKYRINKRQKDVGNPIFAQIMHVRAKDRSVAFLIAFHKQKWQGFIHMAAISAETLEVFTTKRPFQVLELDNPSVLNYYKKKNNLEAFSSSFSLFQFESRLRKTLKYIEQMKEKDEKWELI